MLTVVKPDTLIRWHRQGWRLFWRWKSRPGRPPIPADLQRLIVTMARANPTWGDERIADELRLKRGLTVSPRTVSRYLRRRRPSHGGRPAQRCSTFVRSHGHAVLACDFFTTIMVRFRILYVFVVLDVGTRRIVHWNVTEHPTADWTIQQCRAVITGETAHRFLVHDRDAIFAPAVDRAIRSMGLRVLKTPVRTSQANAFCERLIGTMRPGVSRLADPAPRATPSTDPDRVDGALQSRAPACQPGTGDSRGVTRAEPAGRHRPSPALARQAA
jgi:putative transposase